MQHECNKFATMDEKKYATREQLAELFGVLPRTIDAWLMRGRITRKIKVGRRNYFEIDAVLEEMGYTRELLAEVRANKKEGTK